MSEVCFDCFRKYCDSTAKKKNVVISKEMDICEGCGKIKPVVIRYRRYFGFKTWLKELFFRA